MSVVPVLCLIFPQAKLIFIWHGNKWMEPMGLLSSERRWETFYIQGFSNYYIPTASYSARGAGTSLCPTTNRMNQTDCWTLKKSTVSTNSSDGAGANLRNPAEKPHNLKRPFQARPAEPNSRDGRSLPLCEGPCSIVILMCAMAERKGRGKCNVSLMFH